MTADTFLVEGNKQEHQLSNLKPSTTYSVALYATKGPLTSGTVITNLQTRMCSFYSAGVSKMGATVTQSLALLPLQEGFLRVLEKCMLMRNFIVLDQGQCLHTDSKLVRMSQM